MPKKNGLHNGYKQFDTLEKKQEIIFPTVDNRSYTPLRSDLAYTYYIIIAARIVFRPNSYNMEVATIILLGKQQYLSLTKQFLNPDFSEVT